MATPTLTATLESAPTEILCAIAEILPWASLCALAKVSRRLNSVANRRLYGEEIEAGRPDITVLAALRGNIYTLKTAAAYGADLNRPNWVRLPFSLRHKQFHDHQYWECTPKHTGYDDDDESDEEDTAEMDDLEIDHENTIEYSDDTDGSDHDENNKKDVSDGYKECEGDDNCSSSSSSSGEDEEGDSEDYDQNNNKDEEYSEDSDDEGEDVDLDHDGETQRKENCKKMMANKGYGWATPLHAAASEGHDFIVEWLVSQGVDLNSKGQLFCHCHSVSELAVREADTELGSIDFEMLQNGIWTPLHYAICRGDESIARYLIDCGASMHVRYMSWDDDLSTGEYIEGSDSHGSHPKRMKWRMMAIHSAASSNQQGILQHLVDLGIDVNTKDGCGANILHYAIQASSARMVKYCLSLGAETDTSISVQIYQDDESSQKYGCLASWALSLYRPGKYLDAVLQSLADHGASFWMRQRYQGRKERLKSMVVLAEMAHIKRDGMNSRLATHPFNGWILKFLRGAIAEYRPDADFKNLREQMRSFFLAAVRDQAFGLDVLDMVLDSFPRLGLKKPSNSITIPGSRYEGTHFGAVVLQRILVEGPIHRHWSRLDKECSTTAKVRWLLHNGAETTGDYRGRQCFSAMQHFVRRLRRERGSPRRIIRRGIVYSEESLTDVVEILNLLGEHGGWNLQSFQAMEMTARDFVRFLIALRRQNASWAAILVDRIRLPSEVLALVIEALEN